MTRRPNGVPHPALRPGLRVDRVGTEAVVLDGRAGVVHRLTGDAAEVLTELVMRGRDVADLPARLADAVAGLREVGVLRPGIGRRRVLGTATVGALGIMSLALPSALVAASPGSTRVRGTATDASNQGSLELPEGASASTGFTYRTYTNPGLGEEFNVGGLGYLVVDVLAIGAGGAGGNRDGGGGGGGAVSLLLERQLPAGSQIPVQVGAGGDASADPATPAGQGSGLYNTGDGGGFTVFAQGGAGGQSSGGAGGQSYAGVNSPGGNGGAGGSGYGGGGAGAGGAGSAPNGGIGGAGGPAFSVENFFASSFAVAGGGGGAGYYTGSAGTGGGTGGSGYYGIAGSNATGPGGGGGGGGADNAGTGGNGLLIVRYLT